MAAHRAAYRRSERRNRPELVPLWLVPEHLLLSARSGTNEIWKIPMPAALPFESPARAALPRWKLRTRTLSFIRRPAEQTDLFRSEMGRLRGTVGPPRRGPTGFCGHQRPDLLFASGCGRLYFAQRLHTTNRRRLSDRAFSRAAVSRFGPVSPSACSLILTCRCESQAISCWPKGCSVSESGATPQSAVLEKFGRCLDLSLCVYKGGQRPVEGRVRISGRTDTTR